MQPQPLPVYYERYSSLIIKQDALAACFDALETLIENDDHITLASISRTTAKLRIAYSGNAGRGATLAIKFFRHSSNDRYILEFQRRYGCVVAFSNCYSLIAHQLREHFHADQPEVPAGPRWQVLPAPTEAMLQALDDEEIKSSISETKQPAATPVQQSAQKKLKLG